MIRIITGTAKNRKLKTPNIEGYRAVQEVAKGAIFSIIGENIKDSVCLDLFAGSGNLGLEALSRGAKHCDFVDTHKISTRTIEENLQNLDFIEKATVITKESVKYAANTEKTYDYIFLDPFYSDTSHIFLMKNLEEIISSNGLIIFLHGENLDIEKLVKDTKLTVQDTRRFGKSYFSILGLQNAEKTG